MSSEAALRFDGVSKRFRRRDARLSLRGLAFGGRTRTRTGEFWALQNISFEVPAGSSTGLVGGNGAGKSTLLRLAARLSPPTEGTIDVPQDTLSVLGLGAGFDSQLTGAENAHTALIVHGMTRKAAAARLPAVREFAELEDFFDSPVRTYSSGMGLRLAFAVAVQLSAQAFLVDEVLSVGDLRFQEKCTAHLEKLREGGATILMASHDLEQVENMCDHAVWLHAGQVRQSGPVTEVVGAYRDAMRSQTMEVTPPPQPGDVGGPLELRRNRFGSQEMRVEDVLLNGTARGTIEPGGSLTVDAYIRAADGSRRVIVGISVWRLSDGLELVKDHVELGEVRTDQRVSFTIDRLDAAPGEYRVDIGAYEGDWAVAYDYHWGAHELTVTGAPRADGGLLRPPLRWRVSD